MERHKKDKRQRRKVPRVPIKTYKWEDIRRARLRGGYPWTYLYKQPFDEEVDPKLFRMEKRKSKKSSTPPSDKVDIQEINNGAQEVENEPYGLTPQLSGYIVITEIPSDSDIHSKDVPSSSVTIEDVGEADNFNLESAESSDNISQYLDKDEPVAEPAIETSEVKNEDNERQERSKSEEPKRKRKLSIESSYSRKSLSKLAIMKRLKEAKDKIKVPKLSLPSLAVLSNPLIDNVKSKKEPEQKSKEPKSKETTRRPDPNAKPVYIHIPLKPPEGETDEFSYLEFGETKPEEPKKPAEEEIKPPEKAPEIEISEEPFDESRRFSGNPDDIVAFEILKTETIDLDHAAKNGLQGDSNYLIIEQESDNKSESRSMIIIMPGDEEPTLSRSGSTKQPSRQGSRKERAKSAEPERKRKLSGDSSYSRRSLSKLGIMKKLKDAKDKIKFPNFSLSRSGSKKTAKKTKEEEKATPKEEVKKSEQTHNDPKYIHIPLKPPEGEIDEFSHLEFEAKTQEKEVQPSAPETKVQEQSSIDTVDSPKAEGIQFIFLTPPSDDEVLDHPEIPETPSSESKNFFSTKLQELKQIAKDAVDATSKRKKLQAVKEEVPEKTEQDESDNKQELVKEKAEDCTEEKKPEKMVVDEEDGLKLTESAMAKQEQNIKAKEVDETPELKSNLKPDGSPPLKKKVSFKRKSKDDSKDDDYEYIQPPSETVSVPSNNEGAEQKSKSDMIGTSQSMSVDEEKSYLDEAKIIKTTSLEEDYNRWSKLSDHDYEPVNPPTDNAALQTAVIPTVTVINTDRDVEQAPVSLASSTTSLERQMLGADVDTSLQEPSAQSIQDEIEKKYFSKTTEKPQATVHTVNTGVSSQKESSKPEGPGRFQQAIKTQADKFKSKFHQMKKPNIKLPSKSTSSKPETKKPTSPRFKFEKPKFSLPKIPDTARINLPTFSMPRLKTQKRSLKERQFSTESNAGGSKTNYFDFRTYPRLFKKKPKDDLDSFSSKSEKEVPEFATVPRTKRSKVEDDKWGGRESIRVPLHAEDTIETEEREDSIERRIASHMRYDEDIDDIDDAYQKENQEIHTASSFSQGFNSRWQHGSFHPQEETSRNQQVTDLDSPMDAPHESFDTNNSKDIHSSESSLGIHRRGVLEEIDSDEFFLRQKGISQDNIEVGMYLSSEIREAFKSPNNALADLQREPPNFSYDVRASNQSLPETQTKRKSAKKPKRKKTPHVSHEQISFDQDSELDNEIPPSRPKRRSRKTKKQKDMENVVPYQETMAVEVPNLSVAYLMYENGHLEEPDQSDIQLNQLLSKYGERYGSEEVALNDDDRPLPPPRRHRSLKSLNFSERDSILGDVDPDREAQFAESPDYKLEHEYIIPTPEQVPVKPPRTLSRSSSNEEFRSKIEELEDIPIRPMRTRSRSQTQSYGESLNAESCVEETCVQDFRDSMGYAVIDKNVKREPPLPPPRTPPRRKKVIHSEQKFFTVPRPLNDEPPVRPIRNYSTLGPSRPPRKKQPINMTDEEKENIDITQYIEIEEEPNRDLQSGDVIQKMRDRPLPAPPRPPRKGRTFQDITSQENIATDLNEYDNEEEIEFVEETEVSTQTEPAADDFAPDEAIIEDTISEQRIEEPLQTENSSPIVVERRLITPTHYTYEETITHGSLVVEPLNGAKILPDAELTHIERNIPINKEYDDETSEIPEEFTRLRDPELPTLNKTEVSSKTQQPAIIERIVERPVTIQPDPVSEVQVLKAQKLQVADLDIDRLSVNELLASRIIVSEIESGNIQVNEISSKSGALKVGEIELPPGLVQQLFERLQAAAQGQSSVPTKPGREETEEKKTSTERVTDDPFAPQKPSRKTLPTDPPVDVDSTQASLFDVVKIEEIEEVQERMEEVKETVEEIQEAVEDEFQEIVVSPQQESQEVVEVVEFPEPPTRTYSSMQSTEYNEIDEQIPQRPPRHVDKSKSEEAFHGDQPLYSSLPTEPLAPSQPEDVDDDPPPRPPEPQVPYIPSQPPPSFYNLRAHQYLENQGDIPTVPRRRRQPKPPISRSSSEDSPVLPPSRRRYKSPEPGIPQLVGQLVRACGSAADDSFKRLITHVTDNVLRNSDGQQDLHVIIVILLVLIAGLILLSFGDSQTVHYHHWEFFNPPRDM